MKFESFLSALRSLPIVGGLLFVFSVAFPPLEDATTLNLSIHMLEHILIITSGVLIGYSLYKRGVLSGISSKSAGLTGLVAVALVLSIWHLPLFWDDAVLNPIVHAAEHVSFFAAGFLIGSLVLVLSEEVRLAALVLGLVGHMFYAILLTTSKVPIYPLYSLSQQAYLGLFVYAMDPIFLVLIFYILWNPRSSTSANAKQPDDYYLPPALFNVVRSSKMLRRATFVTRTVLVIALIVTLLGFYAWSAAEVNQPSRTLMGDSTVYILETPVTWNYSPNAISVVIGVNNTVTWVSHSYAYDTITSSDGNFSSGPIPPGGIFTYTFTQPGTYHYHCIYHLWMAGTVTVHP